MSDGKLLQEEYEEDYEYEEYRMEIENRMKNLMWTVSGDYQLDTRLDPAAFEESRYAMLYEAIKQGAFARFFDREQFAAYLIRKVYCGAQEGVLMELAQLCVDAASFPRIAAERPGVREIRQRAFEQLLEKNFQNQGNTPADRVRLVMMRSALTGDIACERRIREPLEWILALGDGNCQTMDLIRTADRLYNDLADPEFEKKHGSLEQIMAITLEELKEFDWRDFLDEEAREELLEQYMQQMEHQMTSMEEAGKAEREPQERRGRKRRVVVLDEEAVQKVYGYIEKTFGRSYLSEMEQKQVNFRLCRGAHCDCKLYYTDGILADPVMVNAQYVNAKKQAQNNRRLYLNSKNVVRRNVETMTDYLRRSLLRRTQPERIRSEYGTIVPNRLWRIGRTDPGKLFYRTTRQDSSQFAVEILMDASGSQRDRQGQVALQAYIISEALSNVGIPHRIMSFCTFWDYTVMQRFRDFDAPQTENQKVLEYTTSSNNRDGLAILAAADALMKREEENRILIVLSDGRPNDVVVNRPGSRSPQTYSGEYAVRDTAAQVRAVRGSGVFVLGVFTGEEQDLPAEKMIFGKDFAYIRDIRNFSRVVSGYLQRLLEQDAE